MILGNGGKGTGGAAPCPRRGGRATPDPAVIRGDWLEWLEERVWLIAKLRDQPVNAVAVEAAQ